MAKEQAVCGRTGSYTDGVRELRRVVPVDVRFSDDMTPINAPWHSECSLPNVSPPALFRAVMGDSSRLDTDFHSSNGASNIHHPKWTHPQGRMWGGQRVVKLRVQAGVLGPKEYIETQQYVCAKEKGGVTLVWWRCGRMAEPLTLIPDMRNETLHLFRWRQGGVSVSTRCGLMGVGSGWFRAQVEQGCREAFQDQQPRFERLLKNVVQPLAPPVVTSRGKAVEGKKDINKSYPSLSKSRIVAAKVPIAAAH
eukprot:Hpha_TRINITY_DN15803_c2_g2::TRINITY_DN15803_c2_g2_i1::g.189842::m.189842